MLSTCFRAPIHYRLGHSPIMAGSRNNILFRTIRRHTTAQVIPCITIASPKSASMLFVLRVITIKKIIERDYSQKESSTGQETITPTAIGLRSRGMSLHFSHSSEHETLFYAHDRLPSLPRFLSRRVTRQAQRGERAVQDVPLLVGQMFQVGRATPEQTQDALMIKAHPADAKR